MPLLALDTSAAVAVAVTDGAGVALAAGSVPEQRHHAERLAPLVAELLAAAGTTPAALTAVVAGTGPAPFTGLRVGLVTARALALALGVPLHGVPSTEALALRALEADPAADVVLVVTDARRREVYSALYRRAATDDPATAGLVEVRAPGVGPAEDLVADLADGVRVVGRGALLHPALAERLGDPAALDTALLDPDPAALARLAVRRAAAGLGQPGEPLYLRRPDAVPAASRKRVLA
ncbi:tRNA (adenosine(37)-N6)-threonylcarbamoyltransferase complex dimerization subunit type 1 TsaB [Cellulomonas endophytica]|uniref:tRNA (adenosine(37)-N6)-threonylcarbamoyltransferase complex dimerization subunit type 1 TsaB n=1 Tax=Cellulomonas endophytica TaxID=2494735 RepID=UPI0010136219|nr:tRNA (adenosine(37)-N6)-threonylcarbamoyltransferase complex dimerization subunit type 1 TsaB [Cellulomonas endophytica]